MKYFIAALLLIIIIGYFFIKNALDKFTFGDIKFVGADLKSIITGSPITAINLSSTITNNNSFSVPVSGLYIELYYQGALIGKSVAPQADFTIPSMGNYTINQSMAVDIKGALGVATKVLAGSPVVFDYTIRAKLFGFYPLSYNGNFTFTT